MNINKDTIIKVLHDNPNEFLTVKDVMGVLNLNGEKAMRRVSRELGRIHRKDSSVKREKCSIAFAYRFIKSPTENRLLKKSPKDKQAKKKKEDTGLLKYTYIKELEEPEFGACGLCDVECELIFQAETSRGTEKLCEECGEKVNEKLGGYGGML
jgi:hypothetical protein